MSVRRSSPREAAIALRPALLAALALGAGYVALIAEHDAVGAVLLSVAYVALVPWAILRAGRTPGAVAVAGRSRTR